MLIEKLHNASNSMFGKVVFILITLSFVVAGMAGYLFVNTDTSAVKVNGEEISQQVFLQQYGDEYQRASEELGASFAAFADTPEFIQGLREATLNTLIDQTLIRQYTDQLGLTVNDERIKREIRANPIFHRDGKFDNALYQELLQHNRISSDSFAASVRESLRLEQLQNGLAYSEFSVPAQRDRFIEAYFQSRRIKWATLPIADEMAKVQISEDEIADYYQANQKAFNQPEQIKVQYLEITPQDVARSIKVSETEIAQYYQDNKAQYSRQKLGHIQLGSETQALDVYESLQKGEDFAVLAQSYSQDSISAANGGDLGWLDAGVLPADFESAAALLDLEQYSTPVKIGDAYHIIKVLAREQLPLAQVKQQIEEKVRTDLANNAFYGLEKKAEEKAFEDQSSLAAAAEAAGVEMRESEYFSRHNVPEALRHNNVITALFDSELTQGGMNSSAMNVAEQHSILVRVLDHKAQGIRPLEDARAEIEVLLKHRQAEKQLLAQAQGFVEQANAEGSMSSAVKFGEEQDIVYAQSPFDMQMNNALFSLTVNENKPTFIALQAENGDVVVAQLLAVNAAQLSEPERAVFATQYDNAELNNLYRSLISMLRANAKIEINQEFINQARE